MASRFRVLITDRAWPDCSVEQQILSTVDAEIIEPPDSTEATLVDFARDVDAIATCWAQVTQQVIEAAAGCQIVARFGIGLDNICVETATRQGIPVTYVPDYCVEEVSDHALALLLSAARKTAFFQLRTKAGEYALQAGPPLRRLAGQTLGLIGFGRIARCLLPKARGLGLNVVATSPSGNAYDTGCPMVDFDDLLTQSDFISIHAPLTEATSRIFDEAAFARMKPNAVVINTSRGGLIDHDALWQAIQQGQIGGAALDVFAPEPPDLSLPLFRDERVIVTPHAGFLSVESLQELRTRTARQVADVLQGIRPENVVNPHIYQNRS